MSELRKCVICGKEFMPKKADNIICSDECRKEYKKKIWHERYKPERKWKICGKCGKRFRDLKGGAKLCPDCKDEPAPKPKRKKKPLTIDQCMKIAREAGMSYGEAEAKGLFKR